MEAERKSRRASVSKGKAKSCASKEGPRELLLYHPHQPPPASPATLCPASRPLWG